MSRCTISTFKIFEMFPDAESAGLYLESRQWPRGPVCPVCNSGERIGTRKAGFYRCYACNEDFTVRTNTIFERSHIPLHKWVYAMYLMVTARKPVSSLQMAKEIRITQKSAWFMMHRIREACGDDETILSERLESLIDRISNRRLTYKRLVAKASYRRLWKRLWIRSCHITRNRSQRPRKSAAAKHGN